MLFLSLVSVLFPFWPITSLAFTNYSDRVCTLNVHMLCSKIYIIHHVCIKYTHIMYNIIIYNSVNIIPKTNGC